jgi:antitoxin FitA
MPTNITVKNIPDELYEKLKRSAKLNRRSINSEIIVSIERSVLSQPADLDAALENARQLRRKTAAHLVSENELNQARNEGRL